MSDVFKIDHEKFREHCIRFNPDNRFMEMSRDTLMDEYFWKFNSADPGVYKFACVDEIDPKFSHKLSETYKCKQIRIDRKHNFDETADFIYALIKKGIYFFMDRDFITGINEKHPVFKQE